jgi:hypothetical protein
MSLATFRASILAVSRGLFNNQIDALSGADALFSAIGRGFEQAWQEGAKECGLLPAERTKEESDALALIIGDNYQYVGRFVTWIVEHSKANGGNFEMVKARASEWVARYTMVQIRAREMGCADRKEIWIIDGGEHCCDCLRMNGRVYRNSIWLKYGIEPQSPLLACFGGHCKCRREPTDLPITKGRPPQLRGPGGCGRLKELNVATIA